MRECAEKLGIWQDVMKLAEAVYELTWSWLREELYALASQARRAAASVLVNLAEGLDRGTPREVAWFAQIGLASPYELDTLLCLSVGLGYGPQDVSTVRDGLTTLAKRISSYISHQEGRE
jgi:four helix bundle protein